MLFIEVLSDRAIADGNHEVTCADAGGNVSHAGCLFSQCSAMRCIVITTYKGGHDFN